MVIKFGTDGWRAVISDEFTFANVRAVAQAIAVYINNHKLSERGVVVGYDTRFLAEHFAEETVKVLSSNRINCYMMDRDTPTPVVAFSVKDKKAGGAVMITASHNPPQYCGMKFISEYGGPAFNDITKEISDNFEKKMSVEKTSAIKMERINPINRYIKHIEEIVDFEAIKAAGLRVVFDPLWGTGRDYLDRILQKFGVKVSVIHGNRDVLFGGITPEPVDEHLDELKKAVREGKNDIGLSTDPDADRFGVVDEQGKFITANDVISMLFAYLVEQRKESGSVVRSVATTHLIDSIANRNGRKVHETPVGFKYIAEIMIKEQVVIGGEESGGLSVSGHVPEKDGILAGLLVCEMAARLRKPLSQILSAVKHKYGVVTGRRINMKLSSSQKASLIESLSSSPPESIAGSKLKSTSKMDGVKMIFDDGSWLLARPSGTEDLVRLYFEGKSEAVIAKMATDFQRYAEANLQKV